MNIGRCSNDDCYNTNVPLKQFNTKFITQEEGYYYCHSCHQFKVETEERDIIEKIIGPYNYYLKHKHTKEPAMRPDEMIQYKYLNQYISNQIPVDDEKIYKNGKTYYLLEEDAYLSLEVLLWKKHLTFEKLVNERQTKIAKQSNLKCNEEVREQQLKEAEERKKQRKEEILINQQVNKNRSDNDELKRKRKEKLEEFKKHKLPENCKEKTILKCSYCKKERCHPFEYMISHNFPTRTKHFNKGVICDACLIKNEEEREKKKIVCCCGSIYYNLNCNSERNHILSKKHQEYNNLVTKKNVPHNPIFTTYNFKKLRKLCALNTDEKGNLIIDGYYGMKKAELLAKMIDIYKEGKLKIRILKEDDEDDEDLQYGITEEDWRKEPED